MALPILANTASGSGSAALGFINTTCSYNPSARAIASISASVDKDLSTSEAVTGFGNSFHPTIEQDGAFYVASIPGPTLNGTTTGYNTLAQSGLTAADFQQYDFSTGSFVAGVPNFAGDPMLFGLSQLFTLDTVPGFVAEADHDNLVISVNTVPELSTWTMMLLGFAGLGFAGYRKTTGAAHSAGAPSRSICGWRPWGSFPRRKSRNRSDRDAAGKFSTSIRHVVSAGVGGGPRQVPADVSCGAAERAGVSNMSSADIATMNASTVHPASTESRTTTE